MKFIHISDLHIGKRVNEYSMLEDQEYILTKIINITDVNAINFRVANDFSVCNDELLEKIKGNTFLCQNHNSPRALPPPIVTNSGLSFR